MHPLDPVNLTELIELCREAGFGNLGRHSTREELYTALEDTDPQTPCLLEERRSVMEQHIRKNYRNLRTQLPKCDGKCTIFGCPDMIVQNCWAMFKDDVL